MADYYFDASAVVKKYVVEPGSQFVSHILDFESEHNVHMSDIGAVEVAAGLARRGRDGDGVLAEIQGAIREFHADFDIRWLAVPTTPRLLLNARNLAVKYFLRGYDAVHLAAACEAHRVLRRTRDAGLIFVSSDAALNAAALSEELQVVDPTRLVEPG
ncbi:hypothetical protein CMK11_06835 [Candidatus Poribacteria bacterium]|nr:hypothetical protein [Candidatus Poribacteria bacterium]